MKIQDSEKIVMATEVSNVLKSLANPHRLLMMCALLDGEASVGALAQGLGVRESVASQHLALLRREGLVSNRRSAQTIYYKIADSRVKTLIKTLYRKFCQGE